VAGHLASHYIAGPESGTIGEVSGLTLRRPRLSESWTNSHTSFWVVVLVAVPGTCRAVTTQITIGEK